MTADSFGKMSRREAMAIPVAMAALTTLPAAAASVGTDLVSGKLPHRNQSFDYGWKFHLGSAEGLETTTFNDADWRELDLPHDWSIEDLPAGEGRIGPFDPKSPSGAHTGFTIGGEGWYRKHFQVGALPPAGQVIVNFDGAFMETDVWLNGHHVGTNVNGYTAFSFNLTPHLVRGGDNVLAVRVRNIGQTSRWYSGSGLYRSVTVDILPEAAKVAQWGVGIVTTRITDDHAEIAIETRIEDHQPGMSLVSQIKDGTGKVVAEQTVAASAVVAQTVSLAAPQLWSPDSPALYMLETQLRQGKRMIDSVTTRFGVRIVTFDAEKGMQINGKPVKLRGGCVHHDNGLLGAAAYPDADERRVLLLKARGFNALRAAVNASSAGFLEACDKHGVFVIEELFDMWNAPKTPQDYARFFASAWQKDLTAMILHARNHPSVIMYGVGNEIPNRSGAEGVEWQWKLANHARKVDPSRPATGAINYFPGQMIVADEATARPGFGGVAEYASTIFLDVVGYNYKKDDYDRDHTKFPKRVFYGSESYPEDVFSIWSAAAQRPYVIGDFVWAAMDYLGETGTGFVSYADSPGPGAFYEPQPFPWITANCADIDIIGGQRAQSFARDVVWGVSPLEMLVQNPAPDGKFERVSKWGWSDELPCWTWPGKEGKPLLVRVYVQADRVELKLDGKVIATKAMSGDAVAPVEFTVPYAPGMLEATAWLGPKQVGQRRLATTGQASAIRLMPENPSRRATRNGLLFVRMELTDADGNFVADATNRLRLTVHGPATLIGFGSGSPKATGSFQSADAQAFRGRCLAVLRTGGQRGRVTVQAEGAGLRRGVATVNLA